MDFSLFVVGFLLGAFFFFLGGGCFFFVAFHLSFCFGGFLVCGCVFVFFALQGIGCFPVFSVTFSFCGLFFAVWVCRLRAKRWWSLLCLAFFSRYAVTSFCCDYLGRVTNPKKENLWVFLQNPLKVTRKANQDLKKPLT